jgi:hypothetical protein
MWDIVYNRELNFSGERGQHPCSIDDSVEVPEPSWCCLKFSMKWMTSFFAYCCSLITSSLIDCSAEQVMHGPCVEGVMVRTWDGASCNSCDDITLVSRLTCLLLLCGQR